jgi:nitrogen regulatory protein PII
MKNITAIIRPSKAVETQEALEALGINPVTITNVMGCGKQAGYSPSYVYSAVETNLLRKTKLEAIVDDTMMLTALDTVIAINRSGHCGDGKLFVTDIHCS